ncbi:hypothetical protein NO1_1767, partial [Candidatus Termititenax aidoneus]
GDPPVPPVESGSLNAVEQKREAIPIDFNSAFGGDETDFGTDPEGQQRRQDFVNEIARGVVMLGDINTTLKSLGKITMMTSVNLTNSDNSFATGADKVMDGRIKTMVEVVREGLIQALTKSGVDSKEAEIAVDDFLKENLDIQAQYTCGSDIRERGYGWKNNPAHDWKSGGEYIKAQKFLTEQSARTDCGYVLKPTLGQCSTLDNNTGQAGYEKTTMGERKAKVEFSQTLPDEKPAAWEVTGDINGDGAVNAETETGALTRRAEDEGGGYILKFGGQEFIFSPPAGGGQISRDIPLDGGGKTTVTLTFDESGEPADFNVSVQTKSGTPQVVDYVADRELQALAKPVPEPEPT